MSAISHTMNIADLKGWVLVAFLGLTLALEILDLARGRAAPITALECWEVCSWGATDVHVWTPTHCECRARVAP